MALFWALRERHDSVESYRSKAFRDPCGGPLEVLRLWNAFRAKLEALDRLLMEQSKQVTYFAPSLRPLIASSWSKVSNLLSTFWALCTVVQGGSEAAAKFEPFFR